MFRARILVSKDSDIASEMAALERAARRHRLDDAQIAIMVENVASLLRDLKQKGTEAASYGISVNVSKTVATDDYAVTLDLQSRNSGKTGKRNPLSWLIGR
jgi:hypothetical protein